jgi:predicted aspartyl protease
MKRTLSLLVLSLAGVLSPATAQDKPAAPAAAAPALPAGMTKANFRRYNTKAGVPFVAAVLSRTDTSVEFTSESGKKKTMRLSELSDIDQAFLRKWTKFKDSLMTSAEFSNITVQSLLELRGYQAFEFTLRGNHIFVEGEIAGHKAVFMIDTGADSSLFHSGAAEKFGVKMGEMIPDRIRGVGGPAPAAICDVTVIKLGDAEITNRKVLAADLFKNFGGVGDYDAILGADFMREMDACISYREGRIMLQPEKFAANAAGAGKDGKVEARSEFRKWSMAEGGRTFVAAIHDKDDTTVTFRFQDKGMAPLPIAKLSEEDQAIVKNFSKLRDELVKNPEFKTLTTKELLELRGYQSMKYRPDGNHILVDGKITGTAAETGITYLIDTGAHDCVFDLAFAEKAKLEMGPMIPDRIRGIGGSAPAAETKVKNMRIGDAILESFEALTADLYKGQGALAARSHGAIFGANFLRQLDVVINYKEGLMFLQPGNADKSDNKDAPDAFPNGGK